MHEHRSETNDRVELLAWRYGNEDTYIRFFYTEHGTKIYIYHMVGDVVCTKEVIAIDLYQDPQRVCCDILNSEGMNQVALQRNEGEITLMYLATDTYWRNATTPLS